MEIGCFSVSLSVKDLARSRAFYEALGFRAYTDTADHGYLIMKNGDTNIGLFQGMFEGNMLTFNPGWDQAAHPTDTFTDVREIQNALQTAGVELASTVDTGPDGPGSFMVTDPDGNTVLFDQHR